MTKYKVRDGFVVHLPNRVHGEGETIELSLEEAEKVAHQVELVNVKKEKPTNDGNEKV